MTSETPNPAEADAYDRGWDEIDQRQFFKITDIESTVRHEIQGDEVALATLPTVTLHSAAGQPGLFELHGTKLGVGGMGEVRLARQPALQRDVAIKVVRTRDASSESSRILLREALVMGYLEHPNIVPIHVVGRDEEEELVVAMKRVEGETLQERVTTGYRLSDLEENLRILIDVCNATEFAHQLGVLHLDVKPSNIMIGPYGEVYLLDWGTAVAYRDDVPETIPRPIDDGNIRGTPTYMAPEMVAGKAQTPATDVFLLGGVLHAILTGRGPNSGENAEEVLECAYYSLPREFPEAVPVELGRIMNRALARRPDDRFGSAKELRDAVAGYIASRGVREMLKAAHRSEEAMRRRIAEDAPPEEVYGAFGATRRLLREAKQLADTVPDAPMRTLISRMCEWELQRDNPAGAQALLRDMTEPDPELLTRVSEALQGKASQITELHELRRQIDPRVANKQKIAMWLVLGVTIAGIYAVPAGLGYNHSTTDALNGHVVYLTLLFGLSLALRRRLFDTRTNREVIGLIWVLSLFGLVVRVSAFFGSIGLGYAIALDLSLVTLTTMFGGWILDRRVLAAVPWQIAGSVASFMHPEQAPLLFGLTHGAALSSIAIAHAVFGPRSA